MTYSHTENFLKCRKKRLILSQQKGELIVLHITVEKTRLKLSVSVINDEKKSIFLSEFNLLH